MSDIFRGRHWLVTLPFALLMALLSTTQQPSHRVDNPSHAGLRSPSGLLVSLGETSNLRRDILILSKDGKTRMIPVSLLLQETDP